MKELMGEGAEFIASRAGFEDQFVPRLKLYSSLHDIGTVGVPKDILSIMMIARGL